MTPTHISEPNTPIILKFSATLDSNESVVSRTKSFLASRFDPSENAEPVIYSIQSYGRDAEAEAMPPLYQIELIESQYSQFLEEAQTLTENGANRWNDTQSTTIRAM